ncbi:MAG: response regulator transcription factor [Anaerolineales bacterium]|nr:MAG: response regulator transcription factor [Anaerolineales bacterium]
MSERIRVILADDHALVRQGIRQFLDEADDIDVVGEAADGSEALKLVGEVRPDVAVLDIQMPELTGIEVTRQIKSRFPEVRVLILTAYDDDPYVFALLREGANGYLLKSAEPDAFLGSVRAVYRGEPALSPDITEAVLRTVREGRPAGSVEQVEPLTQREVEVLRLAAQGLTNRAIGQELGISDRTVQGHLANIYGKLAVGSRTEAVTEALKRGWIVLQ